MPDKTTCPECGDELPANAPEGLCPRCLAKMGLGLLPTAVLPQPDFTLERTGSMIGRYKLLEKIGEGGFGVVYMAEQQEPVQRKVALKIIKAGMDTREVIARFEAERQAIALMDHPNIARALDAGATEAGRPYFVMELVRGIPITDYCDQKQLPTRERLQLFIKVCQAVQHAHQKGVIHRDLKPSNVLVTEHDGEPVPKVIDFGVAKALGQKLTEKTLFTAFNHLIGTPAYMSPEQAALSGLDIDTRADIYSLGVLLYELLTGVTPFDADTLRQAALDEIRRMIRETEPPKPSTRLDTLGEKLTEVAKHRRIEPAALSRLVRGDLDWIVMKCLEKDRQRRYETANGLATDVARHLDNEPVVARPPSNIYRFQKLIRRHKVAFSSVGAVAVSLIICLGFSTWLFVKEKEARLQAVVVGIKARNETARAEAEKEKAQIEAARSQQIAHYLKNMLSDIAPSLGKKCTKPYVQEVLTRVDERVGNELKAQPELEAVVRTALAEVQADMGQYAGAETNLNRVLAIRKKVFGEVHPEVATALGKLAELFRSQQKWTEAEDRSRATVVMWEKLSRNNPTNEDFRADLGHSQWRLGYVLAESEQRGAAIQAIRGALDIFEKATHDFPGNPYFRQEQAFSHRTLADLLNDLGRIGETERHYRAAIDMYAFMKTEAPTNWFYHAEQAYSTWMLATKLERAGLFEEAIAEYHKAIVLHENGMARFPDQKGFDARRGSAVNDLASLLSSQGKRKELEILFRNQLSGAPSESNLIFNGSFELPAYVGDGDRRSGKPGFILPGWTFSGRDGEGMILEYGEPLRSARYADGRQAICLNGDGLLPPIMLAQSFATTPGQDYTLTFAQGDEEMSGPSTSELTVSIADVRRVFPRAHDTGMVLKTLYFTAKSNLTRLSFEDTSPSTPDVLHSPFLDAVLVVPGHVEAQEVRFPPKAVVPSFVTDGEQSAMWLTGKPVPRVFKLPLLDGGEIELPPPTNHGPLLVDFCATWCAPCREAMPVLAGIAKDFAPRGLRYVTVNQGEATEAIRRYLAKTGLDVSVALDKRSAVDSGGWGLMAKAFQVEGIPTIVIVDRSNIVRYVHVGTSPELGDKLRLALEKVLKAESVPGQTSPAPNKNGNPGSANEKK